MKIEAVAKQLQTLEFDIKDEHRGYGTVFIKNLFFPGRLDENNAKTITWYVCTVSYGTQIFATAPRHSNSAGSVEFEDEFKIDRLPNVFEITVSIYALKLHTSKGKVSLKLICRRSNIKLVSISGAFNFDCNFLLRKL